MLIKSISPNRVDQELSEKPSVYPIEHNGAFFLAAAVSKLAAAMVAGAFLFLFFFLGGWWLVACGWSNAKNSYEKVFKRAL